MSSRLELVSAKNKSRSQVAAKPELNPTGPRFFSPKNAVAGADSKVRRVAARVRSVLQNEEGAVTAEYAIVIVAAVAFAGILVAIMRSDTIRTMLVGLIENALGTGG
ncbi:DUF4244 domain-containing protein [Leucobacter viscericola]|uniref:DUF4244 domain-containing protein n=1 Tax=Leucobacter viscericola TaxID=2714935 RepID=UPI00197E5D2C|nr:DUF4244 domain-containing protein [Leucobacter viscericola]